MPEVIRLNKDTYPVILITQNVLRPSYSALLRRAEQGDFLPDPPIILGRMPETYSGRFRYFVYHGHHRLTVARIKGVPLNGFVVSANEEIPAENLHGFTLERMLTIGLTNILRSNNPLIEPSLNNTLETLILELERQEALGINYDVILNPSNKINY